MPIFAMLPPLHAVSAKQTARREAVTMGAGGRIILTSNKLPYGLELNPWIMLILGQVKRQSRGLLRAIGRKISIHK